jgi:hypothetical protein
MLLRCIVFPRISADANQVATVRQQFHSGYLPKLYLRSDKEIIMAIVNAYNGYSLDMLNVNLSNEVTYGVSQSIPSNIALNGTTYPSAYSVELNVYGNRYLDIFAGNFSATASGVVTGGTVSAYWEYAWDGSSWVLANSVTGFLYSAVDFYNAAVSGVKSRTTQIEVNVLSGNDVINGSSGNDALYGGIGNDIISGGGGIDVAVYIGNRGDYTVARNSDGRTVVIDRNQSTKDGADILSNLSYLSFKNQTVAVSSLPIFDGLDVASYADLTNAFKSAGSLQAVRDAGTAHFFSYGYKEGRDVTFDGLDYIASYGDLIRAFGANEVAGATHFINYGSHEGRKTTFDDLAYIANYTDLMKAFGANGDAGSAHYIGYGVKEGRHTSFNVEAYKSAHPNLIGKYASNDAFLTAYINYYNATGTFLK